MKNFKKLLAAVLATAALLGISGCTEINEEETKDLVLGGGDTIKTQYAPITLTENNTLNSIRLFDAIIGENKNAMFSPISLNMALGLIAEGADGETRAAIDSYLQTDNFADFAESYMKLAREKYTYTHGKETNALEIANSLWADNKLPLKEDFKRRAQEKFSAEIKNINVADKPATIKEINGWVSEKTHKLIPSALSDYSEDAKAFLINTVYFESEWSKEWDIDEKSKEIFTLPDGSTKELPLMYHKWSAYYENDRATAFAGNYKNGLRFIGILPKETGEFTLESLDIPALLESETYEYDVSAVMPRLNFETAFPLRDALAAAGLGVMFDPSSADFSGLSEQSLYITDVLQKTKLELDEKKTKAAAATIIAPGNSAMPMPKERKTVRLDRPFAFLIYDRDQGQILFMGKVTEP